MDFENFVKNIKFKGLEPDTGTINLNFKANSMTSLENVQKDVILIDQAIAVLPEKQDEYIQVLEPCLKVPRMSTFANAAIISRIVNEIDVSTSYVNVGIWHGYSLLAGMLGHQEKKVIGVDNFSQFGGPYEYATQLFQKHKGDNHFLFDLDYRDYFSSVHDGEIGFYFYDGEHSYESQLEGLRAAEIFFSRNCIIMVDDINLDAPLRASLDFIFESSNNYEIIFQCKTAWNGHPTFWNGILIFRRAD